MRKAYRTLFALLALQLFGCDDGPNLVPVSGVVLLDGQPQEKLSITFFPNSGRAANGVTQSDGRFELTTFEPGDGALLGEHRVTIVPMADPPLVLPSESERKAMKSTATLPPIPAKYFDLRTTDLKRTIVAGGENEFAFELLSH